MEIIKITEAELELPRKLGLIKEAVLRNHQIRNDYLRMREQGTAHKKELLADKYHLDITTIACILYDDRYHAIIEPPIVPDLK